MPVYVISPVEEDGIIFITGIHRTPYKGSKTMVCNSYINWRGNPQNFGKLTKDPNVKIKKGRGVRNYNSGNIIRVFTFGIYKHVRTMEIGEYNILKFYSRGNMYSYEDYSSCGAFFIKPSSIKAPSIKRFQEAMEIHAINARKRLVHTVLRKDNKYVEAFRYKHTLLNNPNWYHCYNIFSWERRILLWKI